MSSKKELALVLPLLCLLVILPFWRIATGQGIIITNDYAVSDSAHLQHPLRHFASQEWRQGRLPLWTPGVYMGYPLLAEGQAGVFYPFNVLFAGLPHPMPFNLNVVLTFVIAAVGAYLLAQELGASIAGAFMAGLAYALCGYFIAHAKQPPIVNAACWVPVAWWLVERGLGRNEGALLGVGLVLGMQWLAGSPQLAYYATGMTVLYFAGRAWQLRDELPAPRRTVSLFVLALVLAMGLGAVQMLPTYELVGSSERAGGVGFDFASAFPYALDNLKTFLYPLANGTPGTGDYRVSSIFWEDYAYLGLVPLCLGLVGGLVLAWRSGLARFLMGLAVATFTLVLGKNTPFYYLAYRLIPGMGFFRFSQRLWTFVALLVVVLAALALTRLQAWVQTRFGKSPRLVGGIAVLLVLVDLYVYHAPWNAIVDADVWFEPPPTAQAMQERAGESLYRVFSYNVYATFRAAYAQAGGWRGDLGPYIAQRDFLQPSLNLFYDVPTADGYVNLVPDYLATLWGTEKQLGLMDTMLVKEDDHLLAQPGFVKLLGLYNVRFLLTARPVQDETLELISVYDSGAHLYENDQTMPRAFVVPGYAVAQDIQSALHWMRSPAFDPTETVVLLERPDAPIGPVQDWTATANVTTYAATRVVVETESDGPGWLVLSDTYYTGWEATVDGHAAPIYRANGCVRAVPLPQGRHEVVFRFRSRTFYWGALISSASGVLLVGVWVALGIRKRMRMNTDTRTPGTGRQGKYARSKRERG
jgi:hypothetical protein